MAEIKRFPEAAIEHEAMKEFATFGQAAPNFKMLSGKLTEIYQKDIGGDKLKVRISVSGTFELTKEVDKRDPWWVD